MASQLHVPATLATSSGPRVLAGQGSTSVVRRMASLGSSTTVVALSQYASPMGSRAVPVVSTVGTSALMTGIAASWPFAAEPYPEACVAEAGNTSEEALLRSHAQPGDDKLRREVDALRRSMAKQEERVSQLNQELKLSRELEGKLSSEAELTRAEVARLLAELQIERAAREHAEAGMSQQQWAASGSPTSPKTHGKENPGSAVETEAGAAPGTPGARGPSPRTSRTCAGKDEIEIRLREFLEKAKCNVVFRQLNRGWYACRRANEKGRSSNDRHVEVSIVNGKLMVKLETTAHEVGWNNGKPGPIEKFVAKQFEE